MNESRKKSKTFSKADEESLFAIGNKLEAQDEASKVWYPARIVDVNIEKREIEVHFEGWNSKFDNWISMDSKHIKSIQKPPPKTQRFFERGDEVLAAWSMYQKYKGTINRVLGDGKYEVLFDDGIVKRLPSSKIWPKPGVEEKQPSTPLTFSVSDLGSKQDRRDRKRKLIVSELFKPYKKSDDSSSGSPATPVPKKRQKRTDSDSPAPESPLPGSSKSTKNLESPSPSHPAKKKKGTSDAPEENETPKPPQKRRQSSSSDASAGKIQKSNSGFKKRKGSNAESTNPEMESQTSKKTTPNSKKTVTDEGAKPVEVEYSDGRRETWSRILYMRQLGASAGQLNVIIVNMQGKKFRSTSQFNSFCQEHKIKPVHAWQVDYSVKGYPRKDAQESNKKAASNAETRAEKEPKEVSEKKPENQSDKKPEKSEKEKPQKPLPKKVEGKRKSVTRRSLAKEKMAAEKSRKADVEMTEKILKPSSNASDDAKPSKDSDVVSTKTEVIAPEAIDEGMNITNDVREEEEEAETSKDENDRGESDLVIDDGNISKSVSDNVADDEMSQIQAALEEHEISPKKDEIEEKDQKPEEKKTEIVQETEGCVIEAQLVELFSETKEEKSHPDADVMQKSTSMEVIPESIPCKYDVPTPPENVCKKEVIQESIPCNDDVPTPPENVCKKEVIQESKDDVPTPPKNAPLVNSEKQPENTEHLDEMQKQPATLETAEAPNSVSPPPLEEKQDAKNGEGSPERVEPEATTASSPKQANSYPSKTTSPNISDSVIAKAILPAEEENKIKPSEEQSDATSSLLELGTLSTSTETEAVTSEGTTQDNVQSETRKTDPVPDSPAKVMSAPDTETASPKAVTEIVPSKEESKKSVQPAQASSKLLTQVKPTKPLSPVVPPTAELSETVIVAGIEVQMVDGLLTCPVKTCGKHFRKDNLLQMHMKHYHPDLSKLLDYTPSVTDLAYARLEPVKSAKIPPKIETRASEVKRPSARWACNLKEARSDPPNRTTHSSPKVEKPNQMKNVIEKSSPARLEKLPIATPCESPSEKPAKPSVDKVCSVKLIKEDKFEIKDSPIGLFPEKAVSVPEPTSRKMEAEEMCGDSVKAEDETQDSLSSRLSPSSSLPQLPQLQHNKRLVIKAERLKMKAAPLADIESIIPAAVVERKPQVTEFEDGEIPGYMVQKNPILNNILNEPTASPVPAWPKKARGRPKRESYTEVDPQPGPSRLSEAPDETAYDKLKGNEIINCICGIKEEDGLMIQCDICLCWQHGICQGIDGTVPESYVCSICKDPPKGRSSQKYLNDQEWIKQGTLPRLPFSSVSEEKALERSYLLKEAFEVTGQLTLLRRLLHCLTVKLSIASEKNHPKLWLWAKKWTNGRESTPETPQMNDEAGPSTPKAPQPEKPIDPMECKMNLLHHINGMYDRVQERLNEFEVIVTDLEKRQDDADLAENEKRHRTTATINMVLRDMETVKRLAKLAREE